MGTNLFIYVYVIAGILVAITFFVLILRFKKMLRSNKMSRRKNLSVNAEQKAKKLLIKKGYNILDIQASQTYAVYVNSEEFPITVIADYIVEKNGYRFVAEVKNGDIAADLRNSQTRRQMLEYYMAYDVDGLLLINMTNRTINVIQFEFEDEDYTD